MNTKITAKPHLLKEANLSLIRQVLKSKGTATRAEIAAETKISSTTVRSLLAEMMANGEIESMGYDQSSGGRKAERYRFCPDRCHSAAFCISDRQIHALLVNICGEILEITELEAEESQYESVIVEFLDDLISKREIKSIGIGVPGIVEGGTYWKKSLVTNELYQTNIGTRLTEKYGIPVILENNLNATAIGFGRCYEKTYPEDAGKNTNMAYLHFEKGCISAGFIAGGQILRGCCNFAGELGLISMDDDRYLDEWLADPMDDLQYTNLIIKVISWICAILNPQYVALGGPAVRESCIGPIGDGLCAMLPRHMSAQILYSPDVWGDYHEGMAWLTACKMFEEVQIRRESLT